MALTERKLWYQVKIAGTVVATVGTPTITESLSSLTRVAEFTLAEQPSPAPEIGDAVTIDWIDQSADLGYTIFAGTIDGFETESQPWEHVVRCTGQLALLRKVRTGSDKVFTAYTEGDAWKYVMDACGVTYDDADVADTGYVLGVQVPVSWLLDTPGSTFIRELDTVFGMATIEIGADRVIRFPVDVAPSNSTGVGHAYTKGTDIDFFQHHRAYGGRDEIVNVWNVQGPTWTDDDNCTHTVWAKAVDTNPQLGRRVRVEAGSFQSDLIQGEDLAELLVRRFMSMTNKAPDTATAEAENDPQIYPGSKISITDPTYGIEAAPRYFLVDSLDRSGYSMTLQLIAGPGGDEGTVTTGTDRVCNDDHSNDPVPGPGLPGFGSPGYPGVDFTVPSFDFTMPDFPEFDPLGWETHGGFTDGPGTADDLLAPAWVPIWVTNDNDVWGPTPAAGSWVFNGLTGVATVNALESPYLGWGTQATLRTGVPANTDQWTLRAVGSFTGEIQSFFLEVIDNTGGTVFVQNVSLEFADGADRITEFITPDDIDDPAGVTLSGAFALSIIKDGDDFTAIIEQPSGVTAYTHTIPGSIWNGAASGDDLEALVVAWTNGAGGVLTLTELGLTTGAPAQQWASEFGTWSINGANLVESSGFGHAYYIGPGANPSTGHITTWNQIILDVDVDLPSVPDNQEFAAFILEDGSANLATLEVWGPDTTDPGPGIWMYTFAGGGYLDNNTGAVASTPFHLQVIWDKAIGSMDATFTGNITATLSASLGSVSGDVVVRLANENDFGGTGTFTNMTVTVQ